VRLCCALKFLKGAKVVHLENCLKSHQKLYGDRDKDISFLQIIDGWIAIQYCGPLN